METMRQHRTLVDRLRADLRDSRRRDKGLALILTALLLIPLVVLTAFAVDSGAWYAQAERMQRAADAAALAGVVWVDDDDPNKYVDVARETAAKNGFAHNPPDVVVDVQKIGQAQVEVEITKDGDQFFSQLVIDEPNIQRRAVGEFVLPVPLGSPRNFLGTGRMAYSGNTSSVYYPEGLTLSLNGRCTSKNQGDRKAAQWVNRENCSGFVNDEYTMPNYEYYIEVPEGRTYATDVLIYDGAYIPDLSGTPRQNAGLPPNTTFADDFNPGSGGAGWMQTRFQLYQADGTPLDDNDNPAMAGLGACTASNPGADGDHTFQPPAGTANWQYNAAVAAQDNTNFFPTPGSTGDSNAYFYNYPGWFNLCRIPASAPAGRYILRVDHTGNNRNGSNNYAIVANRVGSTGLCTKLSDATCPNVYAKSFISLRGQAGGAARAQFYLAEVEPDHAGKTLRIELWDPAEGGQNIRLLAPNGAGSWQYVRFDWSSSDGNSGNNTFRIPVSSYNFNGDLVTLEYELPPGYNPDPANWWWKIEYEYNSAPTDRTTWSVRVTGDPVHLVE